jgi:dipeptidase D
MKHNTALYAITSLGIMLLLGACSGPTPRASSTPTTAGEPATVPAPDNQPSVVPPRVALKDALGGLEPRDVFQNFYEITQVPRRSGHMEEIRQFLVAFGQGLGLETTVDEAGNVIIRKPPAPGLENRKGVVLQAHMDMVAQKNDGKVFDFDSDPIPAFVSGDYIVTDRTTLGADDGIGMAMIMAVLQSKTLQTGPVEALFTVDEETDMSGAAGLTSDFLQGRTLINLDAETEGTFYIGAAGGGHVVIDTAYPQVPAPAGSASYLVKVQGLKGGHSGIDINLGRGHAIKILVRLLSTAAEQFGVRVASLSGGTAGNAIPREASALVLVQEAQVEAFSSFVSEFETTVQTELAAVEPDLMIELQPVAPPAQVMDEAFQSVLINALYASPQGVIRMSDGIPGLVETSTNLGICNVQDGQMQVVNVPRSSVDSELDDVSRMIASVWELAGYRADRMDYYGAWTPDLNSPILGLMKAAYLDLYGQEPAVLAVHAGLECGTIGSTYPGMDMISIGPTLADVHTTEERLTISSVGKVMDLLSEVLLQMPEK